MRWARACSDYTYTTLSDTKNATSCDDGCGKTQWKCNLGYYYDKNANSCKQCGVGYYYDATKEACVPLVIEPITITINYTDEKHQIGTDATHYYRTLKFYATPSDGKSYNVKAMTYPGKTCTTPGYLVDSSVTITAGTETTYESYCSSNKNIMSDHVAAVETYVDGNLVNSFEPNIDLIKGSFESTWKNERVETDRYTIQYVNGLTCRQQNYYTADDCSSGETFVPATGIKGIDNATGNKVQCGTCKSETCVKSGTAKVYLAYYNNWPEDENVLKSVQLGDTTLQFKQGTTYINLPYAESTKAISLNLSNNSWDIVDPTPGDHSPKCYYKLLKKSTFEKDTGHTVSTSSATKITNTAFYGSVYRGWSSLSSVDCADDYVMVMACFTHHTSTINMHSYCRNYDERYGGTGTSDLQLPKQISTGFENTCYVNNKNIE